MTDAEIAAAYTLVEATTPGPWRNGHDPSHFDAPEVTDGFSFAYYVANAGDAIFIAASRMLVVQLLDEVKRSHDDNAALLVAADADANRSRLAEAMNQIARLTAGSEEATAAADRFAADVERMLPVYEAAKTYIEGDGENDADELCRRLDEAVSVAVAAESRAK